MPHWVVTLPRTWAVTYPELEEHVVMVTATSALPAQAVAWSEVQQQAIKLNPNWRDRNDEPRQGPKAGLAVARMVAMIIYQSDLLMQRRLWSATCLATHGPHVNACR